MSKINFDYDRLIADMDAQRRAQELSVRALGRLWEIRPATIVEWKTKRRRPGFEHIMIISQWLKADLGSYIQRAE